MPRLRIFRRSSGGVWRNLNERAPANSDSVSQVPCRYYRSDWVTPICNWMGNGAALLLYLLLVCRIDLARRSHGLPRLSHDSLSYRWTMGLAAASDFRSRRGDAAVVDDPVYPGRFRNKGALSLGRRVGRGKLRNR